MKVNMFAGSAPTRATTEAHFAVKGGSEAAARHPVKSIQPGQIKTLFIEQMGAVKELLDFCSIKEAFLIFHICTLLLPRWAIFTGFRFWIFNTSMQSRMLYSYAI